MSRTADELVPASVAYHASLADSWEGRYRQRSFQGRLRVLTECLEGLNLKDQQWLDAGCGTGTLSRNLADRGARVVGIDASSEMVARARQFTSERGLSSNLEFQTSSITRLPFSSSSLHGILCSSVFEYVEDVPSCLSEFARVLRPGGLLLVSVPNKPSIIRQLQVSMHRLARIFQHEVFPFVEHSRHHYTQQSFRRLLEQSGFATSRVITFGSPIPVWLQRNRFVGSLLMFSAVRREV